MSGYKIDLHPLTNELITSGMQFDKINSGQAEFDTCQISPDSKALAASFLYNVNFSTIFFQTVMVSIFNSFYENFYFTEFCKNNH